MSHKKQPEILHGNGAKIDPDKDVIPVFTANTVTTSEKKAHETPIVEDSNVEYARKFSKENQK